MNSLNAFILSAGLGERLKPVTEHIPKPLIPILGKPILEIILEKVSALPVNKIGINLHHKREEIEDWIERSAFRGKVEIFREDYVIGTGGALKNAEGLLKDHTFLVHNSDILSDIDLENIINSHLSSGNIATLAVRDHPEINNVVVDNDGYLAGVGKGGSTATKRVTFTGIAVYSPEFLRFLPEGKSNVVDGWLRAISSGKRIGTVDVSGSYPQDTVDWRDIGTPEAYMIAVFDKLREEREIVFIHPDAKLSEEISIDGYVVIEEGCILNKTVSLKNTIVLPGTEIKEDSYYEDCIIGQGYKIEIDIFRLADKILIGTGGSDRSYYRVRRDDGSVVLMETRESVSEFKRHIEYTHFFEKHSIPVPRLIEVNHSKKTAFFEDLGDLTLYSWLKCPRRGTDIERIYRLVIDILISLHTAVTERVSECPLLKERVFDYEYLRWETDYFIESFIKGLRNIDIKNGDALREEFHNLALKVDSFPKTIVHRDFQSQNIMIQKGVIPRLVDYQGARIGPSAYDLASILWDPYYRLEDNMRERLMNYYIEKIMSLWLTKENEIPSPSPLSPPIKGGELKESPLPLRPWLVEERAGVRGILGSMKEIFHERVNKKAFMESLLPCRLQRHMQALGAYGFLSTVKGKKYFLKHVPEGLRLLKEDVSLAKDEYPELYKLLTGL